MNTLALPVLAIALTLSAPAFAHTVHAHRAVPAVAAASYYGLATSQAQQTDPRTYDVWGHTFTR